MSASLLLFKRRLGGAATMCVPLRIIFSSTMWRHQNSKSMDVYSGRYQEILGDEGDGKLE